MPGARAGTTVVPRLRLEDLDDGPPPTLYRHARSAVPAAKVQGP